ncbi:HprK-related kinase A [Echinimonas agarilytica]|uniref:HprK-related kinase A n=1 Tax=Echinimonas agarilytica TaxID=1215918 RepID=A0AA41WBG6_9GAMM|nr:HprK-related kinase A [Echinimonas agarilytica]MCM2681463.1 HprK-related kinase A [Echinimonas agarilytica]
MSRKHYLFKSGPFIFNIETPIKGVQRYLENHYHNQFVSPSDDVFIDYDVAVEHGPLYRRLFAPQAVFLFNKRSPFKPLPLDQAHAMLEWGMNWVISSTANQYLIIHAATLEKDGKAIIISAPPGSGKSTLCAYLASNGWRLLSDELALVDPKTLKVYGLARPMNMKNKSIELMRKYYAPDQFSAVATDTHKGTVCLLKAPQESAELCNIPAEPKLLVFVSYQANEACYSEMISPAKALTEIIGNTFNFGLLGTEGFETAKRLVDKTDAVYIEYSSFESCEEAISQALLTQRLACP